MTRGLRIDTTPEDVEVVSDRLWALGATAISEEWRNDGTVVLRTALGDDRQLIGTLLARELPDVEWVEEDIDLTVADTWKDHVSIVEVTDGDLTYPTLQGEYASQGAVWESRPIQAGTPLAKPSPLFTKLDEALGVNGPSWAPIAG